MHAKPVFVDTSGRRGRLLRRGGIALGISLAGFLAVIGFGIISGAATPLTPWSGGTAKHPRVAAGSTTPALVPKNVPVPGTSGATPRPRTTSAKPTATPKTTATTATATATATATRHGNATHTPPGLARKTKTP